MVDVLGTAWLRTSRWPVYDYLNRELRAKIGMDALAILPVIPAVKRSVGHEQYRLVFSESGRGFGEAGESGGSEPEVAYRDLLVDTLRQTV